MFVSAVRSSRPTCFLALLALGACSGTGTDTSPTTPNSLQRVLVGRLVDVYGLDTPAADGSIRSHARDVLIGQDLPESDVYELLGPHPETAQPRILIRRVLGSPEFEAAVQTLRQGARELDPALPAADRVVPRDGAMELGFERPLADENAGQLAVATQLLHQGPSGVRALPIRVAVHDGRLLIDPVLRQIEARQLGVDEAAGLPEPGSPLTANLTLAFGPQGPAAALRTGTSGANSNGQPSAVFGFRSAGSADAGAGGRAGFMTGISPPRVVGHLPFYLERVEPFGDRLQQITVFKNGIAHDIDRGDGILIFPRGSVVPSVITEVARDPSDDRGQPGVQHVRVVVPYTPGLEQNDPSNLPGYPSHPQSAAGEAWLVQNAPRAVLVAEFFAVKHEAPGDDPVNFITFSPIPLPLSAGVPSPPNQNVSPFAGMLLRFSEPIDMATARPHDSLFVGTRDLVDPDEQRTFVHNRGIDPATFVTSKFVTPHLVASRIFDVSGAQALLRLQPALGLYLDEVIRRSDEGKPFNQKAFKYYLHLIGGRGGLVGQNGMPLDLGGPRDDLVLPFSLDTRKVNSSPVYADNLVASVVRRFENPDEDEQPSYYQSDETQGQGQPFNPKAFNLHDLFGSVVNLPGGQLLARPTARIRKAVDDVNQPPPPLQGTPLQFCPTTIGGETQIASATASSAFGQPLLNPLNPFGARLQSIWREIDMGLSRTDPHDFDLDVEQMYWGAFRSTPVQVDEFGRTSLFLGHGEQRAEPCVGAFSALPTMPGSGLGTNFANNYVSNNALNGSVSSAPAPHAAFLDKKLRIDPMSTVSDPTGVYRYIPMPAFEAPFFVWRDQTVAEQGGNSGIGSDTNKAISGGYSSYIISPFLAGQGRFVTASMGNPVFNSGFWNNQREYQISNPNRVETPTGGSVGAIGLPLLLDFWTYPTGLPTSGVNGLQISLAVLSSPQPTFRAFSAGGLVQGQPRLVNPSAEVVASGGYTAAGQRTRATDNTVYWVMADFLKRNTVATAGFVDITDPHRMATPGVDPRLGPYVNGPLPPGFRVAFDTILEPTGGQLPAGTAVQVEYRGAGAVDSAPWRAVVCGYPEPPDADNFPLDPMKAGDAHIRKFDDRPVGGQARNAWTFYYNRNLTDYTPNPNQLMDPRFTAQFAGPNETFEPHDVRYFNWRFLMQNDVSRQNATPSLDTFAVSYRFERAP